MRVLLDTDVILKRQPFFQDSQAIWEACIYNRLSGYISTTTPVNVFYIVRKTLDMSQARAAISDLFTLFTVCFVDQHVLQTALAFPMSDYEDAVQVAAAQVANIDAVVTRNVTDYANAPFTIFTPPDLIQWLSKQ